MLTAGARKWGLRTQDGVRAGGLKDDAIGRRRGIGAWQAKQLSLLRGPPDRAVKSDFAGGLPLVPRVRDSVTGRKWGAVVTRKASARHAILEQDVIRRFAE